MRRMPLTLALLGLSLTGCAMQENLQSGTDDPCATMKNIVTDYPNGFSDFRKGGSNFNSLTIYSAKAELIRGHCEVWAWGNGDSAYVCTVGAPDPDVAGVRYEQAVEKVAGCLGSQWEPEEKTRERNNEAAGKATVFQQKGGRSPSVSVHRVENRANQSIYLYIGSPGRRL